MPTASMGSAPVRQEMKRVRPTGRRVGRLRLQRGCVCGPPASGLYGASDTALRRRCDSTGRRTNPVAAMIRSTEEKTMKKATAITCVFLDIGGVLLTNGWDHQCPQTGGDELQAGFGRDGGPASPDLRHLRGGQSSRWRNTWVGWSSTKSDRSPRLSFGNSCSRNRNLTLR